MNCICEVFSGQKASEEGVKASHNENESEYSYKNIGVRRSRVNNNAGKYGTHIPRHVELHGWGEFVFLYLSYPLEY